MGVHSLLTGFVHDGGQANIYSNAGVLEEGC